MKRLRTQILKMLAISSLCLLFLFVQSGAHAATICGASGYRTTIGYEYVADRCLPEGMNDYTPIHYLQNVVECRGGNVSLFASYGDTTASPASLIDYSRMLGTRVFRNKEGSHIVVVHGNYFGSIDGNSMMNFAIGQVYTDVFKTAFIVPTPTPDCMGGDFNFCPSFENVSNSTVNRGTGRLSHSQDMFATTSTQPLALSLSLHYRSLQFAPSTIGNGWSHSYEISLTNGAGGSRVFWLYGKRRIYNWSPNGYLSPRGDYSGLVKNDDGTYTITEKDGTKWIFNPEGRITSVVDRNGNSLSFTYDAGRLVGVTDPNGRSASFAYNDGSGQLSTITDPGGKLYTLSYLNGNLSAVSYPDTGQWEYTYGADGLLASKTDPEDNTVTYAYDTAKRVASTADPAGRSRGYAFAPVVAVGKIPDHYPENALPVKEFFFTEKDGNGWSYTYETRNGTLRTMTDPLGNSTSYTYDASRNMLTETVSGIGTTRYSYDGAGNILTLTDPLGKLSSYTYNGFGQVLSVEDALEKTVNSYDAKGNLISTTDPTGAVTQYGYDDRGNLTSIVNPLNKTTTLTYDASNNNLVSVTLPADATSGFSYDLSGNVLSVTDATGKVTKFSYNFRNQLVSVTDPLNNVNTYSYDKNGNAAGKTDANGNVTTYTHDFLGQLTSIKNALNHVTSLTYGAPGCSSCSSVDKLTALLDAKNQKNELELRQGRPSRVGNGSSGQGNKL